MQLKVYIVLFPLTAVTLVISIMEKYASQYSGMITPHPRVSLKVFQQLQEQDSNFRSILSQYEGLPELDIAQRLEIVIQQRLMELARFMSFIMLNEIYRRGNYVVYDRSSVYPKYLGGMVRSVFSSWGHNIPRDLEA